jgi:hypothetical protein
MKNVIMTAAVKQQGYFKQDPYKMSQNAALAASPCCDRKNPGEYRWIAI